MVKPLHIHSDSDRMTLEILLSELPANPYTDYEKFRRVISEIIERDEIPEPFAVACKTIRDDHDSQTSYCHLLRNSPVDAFVPPFNQEDPLRDKYVQRTTFIGEAMLEITGQLTGMPLLAYTTRNNGDFFHDVYAARRFSGMQTQKSDGDLFWHNDRTAHPIRPDFLSLLGMRCPQESLVYTNYIDGRDLISLLSPESCERLREPVFVTPFDQYSRESNPNQVDSEPHSVLEGERAFRYYDTRTRPHDRSSAAHFEALMDFRDALVATEKRRHCIQTGDLLIIANQYGLHSREIIERSDSAEINDRWLLKTYSFEHEESAVLHSGSWSAGIRGLVAD